MEVQQNKFAFFANFAESIRQLPEEIQPKAYQAICEFGIYGILPEDAMLRGMCLMAKASIQKVDGRSNNGGNHNPSGINQHNKEVKEVNSGQFGQSGQILSETETRNKKQEDNITPKNKFSDENVILSPYKGFEICECCSRKARFEINGHKFCGQHTRIELSKLGRLDLIPEEKFIKPTLEEVQAYCQERKNNVDAEKWLDYYTANGWKVGKNSMKDWRAAVRTWERSSNAATASRKTADDAAYWAELEKRVAENDYE